MKHRLLYGLLLISILLIGIAATKNPPSKSPNLLTVDNTTDHWLGNAGTYVSDPANDHVLLREVTLSEPITIKRVEITADIAPFNTADSGVCVSAPTFEIRDAEDLSIVYIFTAKPTGVGASTYTDSGPLQTVIPATRVKIFYYKGLTENEPNDVCVSKHARATFQY